MLLIGDTQFKGAAPGINPKKLAAGLGVDAINIDLSQGDLRGRRAASAVHTLVGFATQQQALYRWGRETANDTQFWLAYGTDVDFARSLQANDPTERTYGTGGGFTEPLFTDSTYMTSPPYGTNGWGMGLQLPGGGMTATLGTAGDGSAETRAYVTTWGRFNDDESGPGPATEIVVPKGSTVNLTSFPAVPAGNYGITKRFLYVSTGGDFRRCAEGLTSVTTLTDTGTRGKVLQTGGSAAKPTWLPPPTTMIGLIELWNGMHGGFDGKQYLTCHPYQPHAWPVEYRRQVPDRIVGTGKWGQNWLLATTGLPRVVMGTTPLAMVDTPINFKEACLSKRSVVGVGHGVCWASSRGLAYHGQAGPKILTEGMLTQAQWRALVPESIIAANWQGWYIGFYNDGTRKAFMIDTMNPSNGIIFVNQGAFAVFSDPLSDTLYLLDSGNVIRKWDAGAVSNATYRSGVRRLTRETNPGAARIVASQYPVTFSMWADGALIVNAQSVTSDRPFRLPSNYTAEELQYQVTGSQIEGVFIGEEMVDLP